MSDPTARLLARTRRRLFAVTLGLVALLVLGIGAATAIVTLRALDESVDSALAASVTATADAVHDGLPHDSDVDQTDDVSLDASDTFVLILDAGGNVVSNPSRVSIPPGLPDAAAARAATATGRDIRTVNAGGTPVRLLTVSVTPVGGQQAGFVQGGFVLVLHDRQSQTVVAAILLLGALGLFGAAIVTLIVTGRALVPIRRSFDAQRRFVADASHELRTPAALIRANADVVEREGLVADDGRALMADIITEADRLGRLVGDLLQLETDDATGVPIEAHRVDIATAVEATVRQAEALATQRDVHLAVSPTSLASAVVSGDPDRLVQLLLILFDNAFDHSPPDGTVTVEVHRAGHAIQVIVSDEGPGIPESERERVFEPFTRLPGVQRDRAGGTGLGLAIARRIASAHHGSIRVADAPGGGAAFVVTLPSSGGVPAS